MPLPGLERIRALLAEHHPSERAPISEDPFELILWEQVAYLTTDDVRARAFQALKAQVGLRPEDILAAPVPTLRSVARIGGSIAVSERAERMRRSAAMFADLMDLGALPLDEARKRLAKFPMIGAPGADKILLLMGRHGVFALDSNGLRVILRVGYGKEGKDYRATYRSALGAIVEQLPGDPEERIALYQRLRSHGLQLCRRSRPQCERCGLRPHCMYGRRKVDP